MTIESILEERQKTHGEFAKHAAIAQDLKSIVLLHRPGTLSLAQREALDMIMHKIARILNGNPNHKDHWNDIAGYATLVARELNKTPENHTCVCWCVTTEQRGSTHPPCSDIVHSGGRYCYICKRDL